MAKTEKANEITLVPFDELKRAARKILSNTKRESDRDVAAFQASNARKRKARKR